MPKILRVSAAGSKTLPEPGEIAERAQDPRRRTAPRRALSQMLRRMRRRRHLSQAAVAERMGTIQPVIARMESATGPWPGQETIAAFAAACDQVAVLGFIDAGADAGARESGSSEEAGAEYADSAFVFLPLGEAGSGPEPDPAQRIGLEHGGVYGVLGGWPETPEEPEATEEAGA